MPKKPSRNGFYYFMLDWRKRAEANGRKFASLTEVQNDPQLSRDWQNLSPEDKALYATASKNNISCKKKTTLGEDVDLIEQQEREKQLSLHAMIENINEIVTTALKHNNLHKEKFYFIHVNYFFIQKLENDEVEYAPAEFAVAAFSLERGVYDTYHEIISESIPTGYAREAKETSSLTHRIPHDVSSGQTDYYVMYNNLMQFLNVKSKGNPVPALYCTNATSGPALSLLNKMANAANLAKPKFAVYSIEKLYSRLLNVLIDLPGKNSIPTVVAENVFLNDTFAYVSGIECDYHKILDGTSQYCSLSIVKQWAFTICDRCCEPLMIDMIEGVHYPTPSFTDVENDDLNLTVSRLSLRDVPRASMSSVANVSQDHSVKASERLRKEEEARRKGNVPLTIIDHSKLNNNEKRCQQSPPVQPSSSSLQKPHTKTFASCTVPVNNAPVINEVNFPKIGGRGIVMRNKLQEVKPPIGRGSSYMK